MEEKKKRWRPSLTAYRELEKQMKNEQDLHIHFAKECDRLKSELDSHIEGTSLLVKDCDAWREKYNDLKAERDTLEKSNKLMEEELNREKHTNKEFCETYHELKEKYDDLKSRGFWARVFNKDV